VLAEQVSWLWGQIAFQLTPLVGVSGFLTLYGRALHLSGASCPGLSALGQGKAVNALLQALKDDLGALDERNAERCASVLLNTFADLVASMIGESMMDQILRSAWVQQSQRSH
jgi:hypothetical protein